MDKPLVTVYPDRIETSLQMLRTYLDSPELLPLFDALEALQQTPDDPARLVRLKSTFGGLGILQGAVLTYAPYLVEILSDDSFDQIQPG